MTKAEFDLWKLLYPLPRCWHGPARKERMMKLDLNKPVRRKSDKQRMYDGTLFHRSGRIVFEAKAVDGKWYTVDTNELSADVFYENYTPSIKKKKEPTVEKKTLDLSKPLRLIEGGKPAKATRLAGSGKWYLEWESSPGSWSWLGTYSEFMLASHVENVPPVRGKRCGWVNVYEGKPAKVCLHTTRQEADAVGSIGPKRLACCYVEFDFVEGEGL